MLAASARLTALNSGFNMQSQVLLAKSDLDSLIAQILFSGSLTSAEQQWLSSLASAKELFTEEEQILVERIFYGIRHGLLTVIDAI